MRVKIHRFHTLLAVITFLVIVSFYTLSGTNKLRCTKTAQEHRQENANLPRKNLYFMKTHKTGSSTLQNILVRYAWRNDLIVGLPKGDILFQSYYEGKKFSSQDMQPIPRRKCPNMILHHMVFDHNEVSSLLPEDTVYVTILRDPVTLFSSAFHYFRNDVSPFEGVANHDLGTFLKEPSKYFHGRNSGRFWWLAKNGMLYDLGFDNLNESNEYIRQSISIINETFHLVIILEYFDMGLILLKSLMNWEMQDVAYVSMNARQRGASTSFDSDGLAEKVRDWNKADTAIYKFFNQTFWKRVESYGEEKMKADLNELEFWKRRYRTSCFQEKVVLNTNVTNNDLKMFNPAGVQVMQYQLRPETKTDEACVGLILPEFQWWKKLSQRQSGSV